MDREEALERLYRLQDEISRCKKAQIESDKATELLHEAQNKFPNRLETFDNERKDGFIRNIAGEEPQKPKGLLVTRGKKAEYAKAAEEYRTNYAKAEEKYYQDYADQRENLKLLDQKAREHSIAVAEEKANESETELHEARHALNSDDILSDRLKTKKAADRLIGYFLDRRVDTMKEAVNLYYEEEHRRRLEDYAQQQVRLTKEAAERARQAAESARNAEDSASEASQKADDAMNRVNEVMDRANEAYELADRTWDHADAAYMKAYSLND